MSTPSRSSRRWRRRRARTCSAIPQILLEQLKVGGRLVAIVGKAPVMEMQRIIRVGDTAWSTLNLLETSTAPLANAPRGETFSF
jgi:protein-L-isoaspartate(D-aspartate) O-methyltransferase